VATVGRFPNALGFDIIAAHQDCRSRAWINGCSATVNSVEVEVSDNQTKPEPASK